MKTQVLAAIGETDLELPVRINAALAANDRIKYYFSLMQMSIARADHPEQAPNTMRGQRVACGIEDVALDDAVAGTRRENGLYKVPGCAKVIERIMGDLRVMVATVPQKSFAERLERLSASLPNAGGDFITSEAVSAITRVGREQTDSLHQLVMDLHKVLNTMQASLAEEQLDGAAVYHVEDRDRPVIASFMAGLNRTSGLKFSHPGLATTATRTGGRLVIQNDLGTTDVHVVVIHVEGLVVEITYTDVHPERLQFLKDMLERYAVAWGEERSDRAGREAFCFATGRFEAKDQADLLAYVEFLGSRLVFLIDWNRARKELRGFLRGKDRISLLRWAADSEIGHRGFLELGGAQLINQAIEATAGSAMHFGDRLCDVLGDEAALEFLRFAFREASEGLRQHRSKTLILDRIRVELQVHFRSEGKRLLDLSREHAGLIFEIASLVRDGIRGLNNVPSPEYYAKLAARAGRFEHDADQFVIAAHEAVQRRPEYAALFRVFEAADDAADEIEEAAFLLGLLAEGQACGEPLEALAALADLVVNESQEWIKALSHAAHVDKGQASSEDTVDFVTAVDGILAFERQADVAERALTHSATQHARDFRQLHLYAEIGRSLESAADALKFAGLITRDHLVGSVLVA
jgi:uncharacterized protein Yka (UPF0111/DUF47 family)